MSYKLLKEDNNVFHVQHPDGSNFQVIKKGLSPDLVKKIQAYDRAPKFDDGGEVESEAPAEPDYISQAMNTLTNPPAEAPGMSAAPSAADVGQSQADQKAAQEAEAQAFLSKMHHGLAVLGGGPLAWARAAGANPGTTVNGQFMPAGIVDDGANVKVPQPMGPPQASNMQATAPLPQEASTQGVPEGGMNEPQMPQSGMPSEIQKTQDMLTGGIQGMAQAQANQAKASAALYADDQRQLAAEQEMTNQKLADNEHEHEQLKQNILNGNIDPRRLWNSAPIGNKIMASIGLILGGAGGGMTHGPNQALALMNNMVNQDIDAQKANLGKQENLMSYNLKKYGDIRQADLATRTQLGSILQAQLAQAAGQSGSQEAMARAQYMIGQIHQQMLPMKMQFAQMQAKAQSQQVGGIPEHSMLDQQQLLMDPKYAETRVPIKGRVFQAADKDSAVKVRDVETLAGPVMDAIDKLNHLGPSAVIPGSPENLAAKSYIGDLAVKMPLMSGAAIGAKRINTEEINHQLERFRDPTKWGQLVNGGAKKDAFFSSIGNELESVRSHNLVNYEGMNSVQGRLQGFK